MLTVRAQTCGVDWLTLTRPRWEDYPIEGLEGLFVRLVSLEDERKARIIGRGLERKSMLGFVGFAQPGLFVGASATHIMVQASSSFADKVFQEVYSESWKCTRLDIQLTIWPGEALAAGWDLTLLDDIRKCKRVGKGGRKKQAYAFHNPTGGSTVYIGAKTSMEIGRIYEKGEESGESYYSGALRLEVQHRDERAVAAADMLWGMRNNRRNAVYRYVSSWFERYGACLFEVDLPGLWLERPHSDANKDIARTKAWLENQVAPALRKLLLTERLDDIIELLGLADDVSPVMSIKRSVR